MTETSLLAQIAIHLPSKAWKTVQSLAVDAKSLHTFTQIGGQTVPGQGSSPPPRTQTFGGHIGTPYPLRFPLMCSCRIARYNKIHILVIFGSSRASKIELSCTRELDFYNFYCLEKFSLLMALGSEKDTQILHAASFW